LVFNPENPVNSENPDSDKKKAQVMTEYSIIIPRIFSRSQTNGVWKREINLIL
jgi:hypothetical protein